VRPYYQDGFVTIYHGDCREIEAWTSAAVLITDPPYGMEYDSGWMPRPIIGDDSVIVRDTALAHWGAKPALVFGRWSSPRPFGTRHVLIWDKGDWPGMGDLGLPWGPSTEEIYVLGLGFAGVRRGSVLRYARLTGAMAHPNEKPEPLIAYLMGFTPAGVIADPFMGSGTMLRVAKDRGRRAIGIEIEERYCEVAARRCAQEVLGIESDFHLEGEARR
jgi:DNA modification methylase